MADIASIGGSTSSGSKGGDNSDGGAAKVDAEIVD